MRSYPQARCLLTILMLAAALAFPQSRPAQAAGVEVALACGVVGMEFQLCQDAAKRWEKETGNTVKLVSSPKDATNRLALFQQVLAAGSPDIDVLQIDVIWPGILGQHLLDLSSYFPRAEQDDFFPVTIRNNTVDGRLVAIPWFMDTGLLYYRKDLLEKYDLPVPKTWDEMRKTAQYIQDAERKTSNTRMWGYLFQGRAYEGLTCNALEWVSSYGGGSLVERDGKVSVNNPRTYAAVEMAQGWINTISPPGVLNYSEEEARGVFQSGQGVFMRNWPYAWPLVNSPDSPVAGKVGLAALPTDGENGKRTGVLGGHHLAVSKYSRHPEEAVALIRFLTSAAEQKHRSITGSFDPPRPALLQDPEVLAGSPYLSIVEPVYQNAVARPSSVTGLKYNQVSYEFWNAVHDVLTRRSTPADAFGTLDTKLERISRHGRW